MEIRIMDNYFLHTADFKTDEGWDEIYCSQQDCFLIVFEEQVDS